MRVGELILEMGEYVGMEFIYIVQLSAAVILYHDFVYNTAMANAEGTPDPKLTERTRLLRKINLEGFGQPVSAI